MLGPLISSFLIFMILLITLRSANSGSVFLYPLLFSAITSDPSQIFPGRGILEIMMTFASPRISVLRVRLGFAAINTKP